MSLKRLIVMVTLACGAPVGWLGNIATGMVAAVVVWVTNSHFASTDVSNIFYTQANLSIMQLVMSLLVGISGCQILTQMSQKNAERLAELLNSQKSASLLKEQKEIANLDKL